METRGEEEQYQPHELLENTVAAHGNMIEKGGVCSAVTLTGIKAFLSGEEVFSTWNVDINNAIESPSKTEINTDFLATLSAVQLPHYHPSIFKKNHVRQTAGDVINFINQKIFPNSLSMQESYRQPMIMMVEDLGEHLEKLKNIAKRNGIRIGCYFGNEEHAFGVCISERGNIILDINAYPFEFYKYTKETAVETFAKFQEEDEPSLGEEEEEEEEEDQPLIDEEDEEEDEEQDNTLIEEKEEGEEDTTESDITDVAHSKGKISTDYAAFEIIYFVSIDNQLDPSEIKYTYSDLKLNVVKNIRCDDNLMLAHVAARFGHADIIYQLGIQNAPLNVPLNSNRNTPTYIAAQEGNLEVLYALSQFLKIDEMNIPNDMGYTPLAVAAQWGHLDVVQFFITNNCPLEPQDIQEPSPLFAAVLGRRLEVVKALLEAGADPRHNVQKHAGLFLLFAERHGIPKEKAEILLPKEGTNVLITPFRLAELIEDKDIVKALKITRPITMEEPDNQEGHFIKRQKKKSPGTTSFGVLPPPATPPAPPQPDSEQRTEEKQEELGVKKI